MEGGEKLTQRRDESKKKSKCGGRKGRRTDGLWEGVAGVCVCVCGRYRCMNGPRGLKERSANVCRLLQITWFPVVRDDVCSFLQP